MKNIFLIITVLIFVFAGCTDKFEEFNTDVKNPADVPGEVLFSNAQKELSDYVNNTNVNINIFKLMAQYWTETTYIDEANYDLITRNISSNIYSRMYLRVLTDLKEAALKIEAAEVLEIDEVAKMNKLQIIELLNVYVYAHLVDVFGAVPYTEALNIENVYPVYDGGAAIYADLFVRLNAALSKLDDTDESFGSADLYYGGNVSSWVKFGNSLKVRMAINIADVDDASAKTAIEAAVANVFTSNDDDCLMAYQTTAPNYNQLYADLIASGRHDFVPAHTLVDQMAFLDDPRMGSYFADKLSVDFPKVNNVRQVDTLFVDSPILFHYNDGTKSFQTPDSILDVFSNKNKYGIVVPQADTILEPTFYLGGTYGYPNSYNQCAHIGKAIEEPNFPGIMLTYAEVCFYLAEAAERGYAVGGTAEQWYNKGIEASFEFWGAGDATAYLAKPEVAYATAATSWQEKIGIQSWIANYTRGIAAYNNWRRLDYPILNLPEEATSYEDIPVRFTFPVNEQTLNAANYAAASDAIGGDLISTKIFWDAN
ncbi:MAG: SusD/RagB family nutrient-binding outer membrane lipoprotein [Salinivirgaceae bacterium]